MNIKKYLEEKKDSISKNAKRAIATGMIAASIITTGVATTGCESVESQMQEKFNDFKENFEYDYILAVKEKENKFVLFFAYQNSGETIAYNISEEQYNQVVEIVENSSKFASVDDRGIVLIHPEGFDGDKKALMEVLNDVVKKEKPFDYNDQQYLAVGDYEDKLNMLSQITKSVSGTHSFNVDEMRVSTKSPETDMTTTEDIDNDEEIENEDIDNEEEIEDNEKDFTYIYLDNQNHMSLTAEAMDVMAYSSLVSKINEFQDRDFITCNDKYYSINLNQLKAEHNSDIYDEFSTLIFDCATSSKWYITKEYNPNENAPEMAD